MHCTFRIDDARVSGEHARITYLDGQWTIRDLGSRNGTYVDGTRLASGEERTLTLGAAIRFGSPTADAWTLVDADEPRPLARHADTGAIVRGRGDHLVLPDEHKAMTVIFRENAAWMMENVVDDDTRVVVDGERVRCGDEDFVLVLPSPMPQTADASSIALESARLRFHVSADEEYILLEIESRSAIKRLDHRAHYDVLLTLARRRLEDRASGIAPPDEGWIYSDELSRMLRSDRERINLDVFRARQQLAELGFPDAAQLVERRRAVKQIRIGVANLEIARL